MNRVERVDFLQRQIAETSAFYEREWRLALEPFERELADIFNTEMLPPILIVGDGLDIGKLTLARDILMNNDPDPADFPPYPLYGRSPAQAALPDVRALNEAWARAGQIVWLPKPPSWWRRFVIWFNDIKF